MTAQVVPSFDFPDYPTRVAVMGDWHGDGRWAAMMVRLAANLGADVIVHTGDFGIDMVSPLQQRFISTLNRALKAAGLSLVFVDGNHDSFDALLPKPLNDFGIRPITTRIAHLPRGFRWTWWDKTWVALGGAQSVNGNQIPHVNWWAEEVVSPYEAEAVIEGGHSDVMVTHDMPDKVHLPGMSNPNMFRADMIRASENHHALIGVVVDEVRPELMLHGHMHIRHDTVRELPGGGETLVTGLDCNGCRNWRDNIVLLDAMTLEPLPLHESLANRRDENGE